MDPPTSAALGVTPATILKASPPWGTHSLHKTPADLGLAAGDVIDAMQVGSGDRIAISLAPGSPSLAGTYSPGDVFLVTPSTGFPGIITPGADCWIPAEYLSLSPSDNLDALWIQVGDPGSKRLKILTDDIPTARPGIPYDTTVIAVGGVKPYNWSVSGRLPAGISFDRSRGRFTGQTFEIGNFPITVQVQDMAGTTKTKNYNFEVRP